MKAAFTFAELSEVLRNEGGQLYWKVRRGVVAQGTAISCVHNTGYIVFGYKRKQLLAHRVVWLLETGEWPTGQLDHINGDKADNRIENLRIATFMQNAANRKVKRGMPKGVTLHRCGRFQAVCAHQYLGLYEDAVSAGLAYDAAAIKKYGAFAKTNYGEQA
jgi:hypothetical protein